LLGTHTEINLRKYDIRNFTLLRSHWFENPQSTTKIPNILYFGPHAGGRNNVQKLLHSQRERATVEIEYIARTADGIEKLGDRHQKPNSDEPAALRERRSRLFLAVFHRGKGKMNFRVKTRYSNFFMDVNIVIIFYLISSHPARILFYFIILDTYLFEVFTWF